MTTTAIRETDPREPDVQALIAALDEYAAALYPAESNHLDPVEELVKTHVYFVGAYVDDRLVGCGAVKRMAGGYGEIKRMYVSPDARGKGVGGQILFALEQHLIAHDIRVARLETGVDNTEALGLYRKLGYEMTGPFGCYVDDPLSVFMQKTLLDGDLRKSVFSVHN
jgi:putative acetyltransferase